MSPLFKRLSLLLSRSLSLPTLGIGILLVVSGGWYFGAMAQAQPPAQPVEEVRVIYPNEWSVQRPAGLAYSVALEQFFVMDRSNEEATNDRSKIVAITPYEELVDAVNLNFGLDRATNIAFDDSGKRLFVLNHRRNTLAQVMLNESGRLVPGSLVRYAIPELNLTSVQAITVDSANRFLYILDSDAGEIVRVRVTNNGINNVQVQRRAIKEIVGDVPLRGLAVHPQNSHIFTLSPTEELLYELSQSGTVIARYDLAPLDFAYPESLTFAPSSDGTDEDGTMHLFITDSNAPDGSSAATTLSSDEGIGALLSHHIFLPLVARFGNATTAQQAAETVSTETAKATAGAGNTRYGEIVEIMLGRRLVAARAAAVSQVTANLVQVVDFSAFSPPAPDTAGVTYLSNRNRLLISDSEVNEMPIYAGANLFEMAFPNTLVQTGNTLSYSDEPTGVSFNPTNNHVFVSDDTGSDKGVYEVNPGADGIYGNNDDTVVSHISSQSFGSNDPEDVTYETTTGHLLIVDGVNNEVYRVNPGPGGVFGDGNDIVTSFDTEVLGILDPEGIHFDVNTNSLFIAGKEKTLLYQVSTTGTLLQTIDISVATTERPAGVTIAPGTNDPTSNNLFLVDRGLDNDSNPNENDGKLFEFTFAVLPTPTPTNTSTPPAFCAGPVLSTSIRIAASTDDAEETIASGALSITSSDLELGSNGTILVGVRFPGVAIAPGNTVINAYVEFEADEAWADPTTLTFRAQAANNAATFANVNSNISSRATTGASVNWTNVPAWTVNGKYRSPNLAPVIQEVVNRGGWNSGNALALMVTGTGLRVAEAFDGEAPAAPLLFVEHCAAGAQSTATPTPTETPVPTATATETPVPTATATETETPVPTATVTETETSVPTATVTVAPSVTATPTNTPTLVPTNTPTLTPTNTPTVTPTVTGTPLLYGDCNGDAAVNAGDLSALTLEIFDADGDLAINAGGGTFPGTLTCDANADTLINAGDLTCAVLLIFEGPGSCSTGATLSTTADYAMLEQRVANFP